MDRRRRSPIHGAVSLTLLWVIAALGLVACGAAKAVAPRLAVSQAAEQFADQRRMAVTLSLAATENDAVAFFSDGEELTPEDRRYLQTFLKSRLVVASDRGADVTSSHDDTVALDMTVGDIDNAIQIRVQGSTLYARAAVDDLIRLFGASRGDMGYFLDSAEEAGFGFLAKGAAGKWLSTDATGLQSFLKGVAQEGSNDEASELANAASISPDHIKGFRDAFSAAWGSDIGVERLGKDTVGDHLRLTSSPRKIYDRFLPALRNLPGLPMDELPPSMDVPDKQFHLDVWVKDKSLTRAEFDLTQLVQAIPASGPVTLRLDIDPTPRPIVVPTDAVKVDLLEALGRYLAGMQEEAAQAEEWLSE